MQKIVERIGKYKYVVLMAVIGALLLALPSFEKEPVSAKSDAQESGYSLERTQKELEGILGHMDGVGRVRVMLSVSSGSRYVYQENRNVSYTGLASAPEDYTSKSEIVVLDKDHTGEDALQSQEIYPSYVGALVVCDGADQAGVVLHVKEAVSVLTGLGSECISVAKFSES